MAAARILGPDMPWSAIDEVLFAGHLHHAQSAIDSALADLGYDCLVIAAGTPRLAFLDDQSYPFRANPWFSWLVPAAAAPGSQLQLVPGRAPRLNHVAPEDYWHSPPEAPHGPWTGLFDIAVVPEAGTSGMAVDPSCRKVAWIAEEPPPVESWERNPPALLTRLEQARCLKSPYELACLREATRIGVAGHLAAERAFRQGAAEFDIHLAFLASVRQAEAELPYPPIVALNEHAATLHYQRRDVRPPARPLSLLIDAGAGWRGYASDITRSWARNPGLFASLIDGVHALQQELCNAVAPGIDWRELHFTAHRLVARLLRDAGVIRMEPEEALASGVSAAFLPHGLGHLLGLQVHDVGGFRPAADAEPIPRPPGHPALRLTRKLAPGMVVTVEPGVYFIDSLLARLRAGPHAHAVNWPLVEGLSACGGIRIEDNVVVTASGRENLTRTAFASVG
jgi:Xaa-Pro dipeptidase